MWERFYDFLNHLNRMIENYPSIAHFTIEMDQDLHDFTREIGFMPEDGIFRFKDTSFTLG